MKRQPGLLACAAFIAAALAAPAIVPLAAGAAESNQEILKTIIEKTRQREEMFDGFDWRMTMTMRDIPGEEGAITGEVRYVKSRARWFAAAELRGAKPEDTNVVRMAFDGEVQRELEKYGEDEAHGRIGKSGEDVGSILDASLGLRLEWSRAPLSDLLEGDMNYLGEKYADLARYDIETSVKGEEVVAGHNCSVVECVFREKGSDKTVGAARFYLAPELGYACTEVEGGVYVKGTWSAGVRWELDDFREVKNGFFFPFSMKKSHPQRPKDDPAFYEMEIRTQTFDMPGTFDDALFTFQFPPGTRVNDMLTGEQYSVGAAAPEYVIKGVMNRMESAGEAGEIAEAAASTGESMPPADVGTASQTGSQTAAPATVQPPKGGHALWVIGLAGAAAVVVVVVTILLGRKGQS